MSRLFNSSAYPLTAPKQRLSAQPMKLYVPTNEQPLFTAYFIDWSLYNNAGALPNVGIPLDLANVTAGSAHMSRIASVYIDNTSSNVPVYVVFPDTGFTVACGPGDAVSQTVLTAKTDAVVYGVGFTGGPQPLTTVYFSNQVLQPSSGADFGTVLPQYICSTTNANIPNNTSFRNLAIGDQQLSGAVQVWTSGNPGAPGTPTDAAIAWPAGYTALGCYVYITSVKLNLVGTVNRTAGAAAENTFSTYSLYSADGELNIFTGYSQNLPAATVVNGTINAPLYSNDSLQIKVRCDSGNSIKIGQNGANALFFNTGGAYGDAVRLFYQIQYTIRNETTLF